VVAKEKDAQTLLGLVLIILVFTIYWFLFIKLGPTIIDQTLIENAGSPQAIINS